MEVRELPLDVWCQGRTATAPPRGKETPASPHKAVSATAHPSVTTAAEIMAPYPFQVLNYTQVHLEAEFSIHLYSKALSMKKCNI